MTENTVSNTGVTLRRERRIPTSGQVLVEKGDTVDPETVIAKGIVDNPLVKEIKIFAQLKVILRTSRSSC